MQKVSAYFQVQGGCTILPWTEILTVPSQSVEDHLVVLCYVAVSPQESLGYVTSVTCSHTSQAYIHTTSITVLHYIQWFYLSLCDLPYHPTPPPFTQLNCVMCRSQDHVEKLINKVHNLSLSTSLTFFDISNPLLYIHVSPP
jgi:hypothetical protein